jgi:predicted ester cyclase
MIMTMLSQADEYSPPLQRPMRILVVPDIEQLQAFATRYTAAWCSMDPALVAEHYAPGGSLTINDGPPAVGRAAITETARGFYVALPDMQVFMDDLVVEGDRIEFHWTFTGTSTGPGGTGKAVRVGGYEEWTIDDDGLIAASLGHYDLAEYARQLEHGV